MADKDVVFLLGAGASVDAGVPDTYSFVKEFKNSISDERDKTTIDKIIDTLKRWKGSEIDVELLLDTLTKLDTREKEPLLKFYEKVEDRFILKDYSEKRLIIKALKDFIKAKAIIKDEMKIKYLEPFLGFIEEFRPLDIVSLNYDTCIEQFCNVNKLNYQDGFAIDWNPKIFEEENTDIRLYKLHGSIIWYHSSRGGYIKLPVMTNESSIELITGETAESLMLYPMQKLDYAEPLFELLLKMKHRLESTGCKFLIVVGYSFRDDHILRILWDAARINRNLTVILIDPSAYNIYTDKLKYFDKANEIPSSLNGKVVCLPYKFEKVFPILKDLYLKNLREGLKSELEQKQHELRGENADWVNCLRPLINAEYTEKIEKILEKIDNSRLDLVLNLKLLLKMYLNLSANNQEEKAKEYLNKLKTNLYSILVEKLFINIPPSINNPITIEIKFKVTDSGFHSLSSMKAVIDSIFQEIEKHSNISHDTKVEGIKKVFSSIIAYLHILLTNCSSGDQIASNKYMKLRNIDNNNKFLQNAQQIVNETEKHLLEEIINSIK